MGCPHPAHLQAYGAGALPDEQMDAVRLHLVGCAGCHALLEVLAQAEMPAPDSTELDALRRRIEPALLAARGEERRPWRWRPLVWTSIPVIAVALVTLAVGLRQRDRGAPPRPEPAAVTTPDITLLARLDPAPVELPLEDLLVTRSTGAAGLPPELVAAFQAYQRGEYPLAVERFGAVVRKGSGRFEVHFYYGVALLLSGQAREAVPALQKASSLATSGQAPRVQWYLAQTYLRLADASPARAELESLCRAQGDYGRDACEVLRRLNEVRK
jgi:hypothetical protein